MLPVVAESIPAIVRVELEEVDVSAVVYVLGFDDDKEDELKPEADRSKPLNINSIITRKTNKIALANKKVIVQSYI